jgi:hypothetical protein
VRVARCSSRRRAEIEQLAVEFATSGIERNESCRRRGLKLRTFNRHRRNPAKREEYRGDGVASWLRLNWLGGNTRECLAHFGAYTSPRDFQRLRTWAPLVPNQILAPD